MISSPTASCSIDRNSDLELSNVASKFSIQSEDARIESSVDMSNPRFQTQLSNTPFLYVHNSSNSLYVNPNSPNTFLKTAPSVPMAKSTTIPHKPISGLSLPSNQSLLLPNKNSSLKPQQIVIQKGGTFVIKPVGNLGNYGENVHGNKIHITSTTTSYVKKPAAPKFVLTSLPKQTGSSAANPVRSNLAMLPLTVPSNTTEQSSNSFKIMNTPLLSIQISDTQVPSSNSPISLTCDSNSCSSDNSENKLICSEIIDLDSPVKEELSPSSDIIQNNSSDMLDKPVKKPKELKFSTHGVSILKKSITFGKDKCNMNAKPLIFSDSVSALTISKDADDSMINTEDDKKISVSLEPKVPPVVTQKSGRRKSSFCFRKDFDDSIQFFDDAVDLQRSLEVNGISLTREVGNETISSDKNEENDIEINLIQTERAGPSSVSSENFDNMIKWENGIGKLPGTDLKFKLNEFDMIEVLTNSDHEDVARKSAKPKDTVKEEDIRCIQCGCYGLLSDFYSSKYCSFSCKEKRKELIKEKELKHKKRKKMKKRETEENKNENEESESSIENSFNSRLPDFWRCKNKEFSWAKYLEYTKSQAAPVKLFADPFPYSRNKFKTGMLLEGIDPHHPSHFCLLSVVDVQGYRMRLHFEGFSKDYDFWVNADSNDIFPLGWCEKNGRYLNPPPEYADKEFNWMQYVKETKSIAAPKSAFPDRSRNVICPIGFRAGMKLEAVDMKNNTAMVCVATVRDVLENRILVHFDSWDDIYDYWADPSSPYIHPIGWCDKFGHSLTPPNDYPNPEDFGWDAYLKQTNSSPAPVRAFKQKAASGFKKGMKLECVDKRIPQFIRVASVVNVRDHQIRIQFDGWPDKYSYWIEDDSPDIHPATWCQKTGHPLEPPLTPDDFYECLDCPTIGCKGIGHASGPKHSTHSSTEDCPLSDQNLFTEKKLPDRLLSPGRSVESVVPKSREPKEKVKTKVGRPPKRSYNVTNETEHGPNNEYGEPNNKKICLMNTVDSSIEGRIMNYIQDMSVLKTEKECQALHSKFLSIYTDTDTDPLTWSISEVASFIQSLPTGSDYSEVFEKHMIDGEALLLITQNDIMDVLNIKLGPAIKLYNSIILLREKSNEIFKE